MIMRDFRYIIKKILIGFGILVLFSLFKSCNVYALESEYYSTYFYNEYSHGPNDNQYSHTIGQNYKFVIDGYEYNIEYKSCGTQGNIGLYINDFEVDCSLNSHKNTWIIGKWPNSNNVTLYYAKPNGGYNASYQLPIILTYPDNFPVTTSTICASNMSSGSSRVRVNFENGVYSSSNTSSISYGPYNYNNENYYNCILGGWDFIVFGSDARVGLFGSNNRKWISSDFTSPNFVANNPIIESLQYTYVTEDDDFGTVYTKALFRPKFSIFNTTDFSYSYWFDDSPHLSITENEQLIDILANGTLYVAIKDSNNNVVDSETFTVDYVGDYLSFNNNFIKYVYVMSTNDNSDATNKTYTSEGVSQVFGIFDLDKYDYYYKFVPTLSNESDFQYEKINENYYSKNFTENGRIYTKVTRKNTDSILVSSTFDITEIGNESSLITEALQGGSGGKLFNTLNDIIHFGGPISEIILIPSQFITRIIHSSEQTCRPISLGSFRGKNLSLPCIDIESYIGSNLWNTIDLLMVVSMIIGISVYFRNLYTDLVNLDYKPKHTYSPKHASDEGGGMV